MWPTERQNFTCSVFCRPEVSWIGSYDSAKDLWDKFLELHVGTSEAKLARRDIFRTQLTNLRMNTGEKVA